ncbi:MAG: hypothetical protein ACTSPI_13125 [Candidatus Heimdallarchaeaceae archaeon]
MKKEIVLTQDQLALILDFYKTILKNKKLLGIKSIIFKQSKVFFKEKYSFLFMLITTVDSQDELAYSQLHFLMNLFLHAFDVYDEKSANDLIKELECMERPFTVSTSISHAFELKEIIDSHLDEIEVRNFIEVFANIFNALWVGVINYVTQLSSKNCDKILEKCIIMLKEKIKSSYSTFFTIFNLTIDGFSPKDDIILEKLKLLTIEKDFFYLLEHMLDYLEEEYGCKALQNIISFKLKDALLEEWRRMNSLSMTKKIIDICWR